jgi:hypothetical protein
LKSSDRLTAKDATLIGDSATALSTSRHRQDMALDGMGNWAARQDMDMRYDIRSSS